MLERSSSSMEWKNGSKPEIQTDGPGECQWRLGQRPHTRWAQIRDKPHTANLAHLEPLGKFLKAPITAARCSRTAALGKKKEFFSLHLQSAQKGRFPFQMQRPFSLFLIQIQQKVEQIIGCFVLWVHTEHVLTSNLPHHLKGVSSIFS